MDQTLNQRRTSVIVFAIDTNVGVSGSPTSVVVGKETVSSSLTVESYLESLASHLPSQYRIVQKEAISLNRYPTGRLVAELSAARMGKITQVVYAMQSGGAVWQVVFTTPADEFNKRLPVFEQMAETVTAPPSSGSSDSDGGSGQGLLTLIGAALMVVGALLSARRRRRNQAEASSAGDVGKT